MRNESGSDYDAAFRRNNAEQIVVIWPRAAAFAGCVLCVVMSWAFWHNRDGFPLPVGLVIAFIFFIFGVNCGYQFIFPPVIFVANYRGIQIGSGTFARKVVRICWNQYNCAERGTIREELKSETAKHQSVTCSALRVNFNSSVDADTRYGFPFAKFETDQDFVIEEKWLGMSIEEAITILNSLAERSVAGAE